jgi:hypothetical protein
MNSIELERQIEALLLRLRIKVGLGPLHHTGTRLTHTAPTQAMVRVVEIPTEAYDHYATVRSVHSLLDAGNRAVPQADPGVKDEAVLEPPRAAGVPENAGGPAAGRGCMDTLRPSYARVLSRAWVLRLTQTCSIENTWPMCTVHLQHCRGTSRRLC